MNSLYPRKGVHHNIHRDTNQKAPTFTISPSMPTPFHSPIEKNLVWLAGFLEGDGCFGIQSPTSPYISVQVVDESLLQFIAFLLETNVTTYNNPNQPKWHKVYRTRLHNREKLRWLLPRLYPYLSARRNAKCASSCTFLMLRILLIQRVRFLPIRCFRTLLRKRNTLERSPC